MTAEIHPFACARPHPQRGDAVLCSRQRAHAGDHRGNDGERLLEWADNPYAWPEGALSTASSDDDDWPDAELAEGPGPHREIRPWELVGWIVAALLVILAPAAVAAVYGAAF